MTAADLTAANRTDVPGRGLRARLDRVPYKWMVAVAFTIGVFMDIMDTTIVNVALPQLAKDFGASTETVEWIVLGYLLSLAVWIPASGWLGDRIGTKRVFTAALAMFVVTSALCGLSQTLPQLIAFRILQGVGGGMLVPVGVTMLFRAFPPHERARASTVLMIPTVLAPAIGPVLGGFLVTRISWHWIFFVNLPLGVVGVVVAAVFLKEHREPTAGRFDVPGFVLSAAGLTLVLYALSQGPRHGWGSWAVLATGGAGLACFVALVVVELTTPQPMLAFRLFRDRMFRNANLVMSLAYGSFAGLLVLTPLFLQQLRGLTALESGLTTFPQAVGMILSGQVVGRLYPHVGPRRLIGLGMLGMAVVSCGFLFVDLTTDLWWIRLIMFLRGVTMAFTMVPLQAATYANIAPADTGRASAIFSTQRQVAAALGVAVLTTVLVTRTNALTDGLSGQAALDGAVAGFHDAFLAAIVLTFLAAVSALFIRDRDAAATMRPRPSRPAAPATALAGQS